MNWDPITRIVGSLGIFTKIDFENKEVAECHSTSSIFRGYSIFMKGKDPRDAHFITSRICGICGDNHATCATYAQNMAFGVQPPAMAEWIVNLGEAAEYMFDHNIFQDNLVGVDFCEQMVKATNPGVWAKAQKTPAPHAADHGYRTIADIMTALNPFTGEFYRETLQVSRYTREAFCLMEGRHVHPSTLYPGGVGTVPTVQLFTDYLVRLARYAEFMKKCVPLHDDLFDFWYEALPGYEKVGIPPHAARLLGLVQQPGRLRLHLQEHGRRGATRCSSPRASWWTASWSPTDLVDINLGIRILLGHSFYDDWQGKRRSSRVDPLGNPVDQRHPWNQTTIPRPQKRDFDDKYSWTMSPRWFDGKDHLALDTGGGPLARFWATALAGLVDIGYVKATGHSVKMYLPKTATKPEAEFEWKIPKWSNALERTVRVPTSRSTPRRGLPLRREGARRAARAAGPRPGTSSRCPTRSRSASASHRSRPKTACCRQGPGSPAASARIHPVLRRSSPSSPSTNRPAFNAVRSCSNNGRIRFFTSRSDDAHNASVVSIDAPVIHDLRIMVTHGFRNQQNAPAKNYNCNASSVR